MLPATGTRRVQVALTPGPGESWLVRISSRGPGGRGAGVDAPRPRRSRAPTQALAPTIDVPSSGRLLVRRALRGHEGAGPRVRTRLPGGAGDALRRRRALGSRRPAGRPLGARAPSASVPSRRRSPARGRVASRETRRAAPGFPRASAGSGGSASCRPTARSGPEPGPPRPAPKGASSSTSPSPTTRAGCSSRSRDWSWFASNSATRAVWSTPSTSPGGCSSRDRRRPRDASTDPGAWLILPDRRGVAARLAKALEHAGHAVRMAAPEDVADPARLASLLSPRTDRERLLGVVHLGSLDAPSAEAGGTQALDAAQVLTCDDPLRLVQALAERSGGAPPRLWLVSSGAQAARPGEVPAIEQSPLWGLGRVVASEHPELRCTPRGPLARRGRDRLARGGARGGQRRGPGGASRPRPAGGSTAALEPRAGGRGVPQRARLRSRIPCRHVVAGDSRRPGPARAGRAGPRAGPGRDPGPGHRPQLHERDVGSRRLPRLPPGCGTPGHRVRGPGRGRRRRRRDAARGRRGAGGGLRLPGQPRGGGRSPRATATRRPRRRGSGDPADRLPDRPLRAQRSRPPARGRARADPRRRRRGGPRRHPDRPSRRRRGLRHRGQPGEARARRVDGRAARHGLALARLPRARFSRAPGARVWTSC